MHINVTNENKYYKLIQLHFVFLSLIGILNLRILAKTKKGVGFIKERDVIW